MDAESNSAITCVGVSKRFSGKYAVHGADLEVEPGTIHALVGENGAGKSTLLGMISGRVAHDEGSITIFGEALTSASPAAARSHGLAVVYQELSMVPTMTTTQNVFLGQLESRGQFASDRGMRRRFLQLCREFDVQIDPNALARDISVSHQQILEIMRGVESQSRILILDEPSAALAEGEREVLYRILMQLKNRGSTIVFVSHNLDEVLLLSDHITVMRDSEVVSSAPRSEWDKPLIVRKMVGKDVVIERRAERFPLGDESLSLEGVNLPGALDDIHLTARAGEIVGLWGLVGSGRTTFFRALSGLEPKSHGSLRLNGRARPWPRSMRAAIAAGIVMVPESRRAALVMGMNSVENYWLGRRAPGRGLIIAARERPSAADDAAFFGFNPRRLLDPVRNLSGGNQQKALLAKWAGYRPRVFLVDEPTRGIDVGAKAEVLSSLVRLARDGATILVTSSELEEVLAICDRLLVFSQGKVVKELATARGEYSVGEIMKLGFGEHEGEGVA